MSKRKRYKPRGVNPMAYLTAIMGSRFISKDDILQMSLKPSLAVDQIRIGQAAQEDWQILFDACNLLEELIKRGHAKDPDGLVDATQEAVVAILDRAKTGKRAVYPAEMQTLRDFCAAYSLILESLTNQQLFVAFEAVQRRLVRVMASKSDNGVIYVTA